MPFHPDIKDRELAALLGTGALIHALADFAAGGGIQKVERDVLLKLLKKVIPAAGRQALRMGGTGMVVARKHPLLTAGAIAYIAHTQGVSPDTARAIAEQELEAFRGQPQFFLEEQLRERIRGIELAPAPPAELFVGKGTKRKISRANTAVKQGMKWLKQGTKAATGAVPGALPTGAFRITVKAAGMANPKTKSKPGKGKSIMNKLARRLKKWW